ncbi:WD40 repeat domain-containing protein [Chloropicon primus]|uniref:WD40 repeat domain-containing protein n=1 Tax=Chloropicon primus TaxID=1764295 RepID=A0A5B8MWL7_9CHLO|nr:WD40 repeat domain-containing protein [Chloropicon primus]UPR04158.1 WD40 repeat domain-containing protein [Chloropicon primus]|eukprot:QDZ24949.1 WD40 repeat domain-containing protein [Chloropicon primus]
MVKAYLRYEHSLCFGIVASTSSRTAKIVEGFPEKGDTAIAPALEGINLWQLRKGVLLKRMVPSGSGAFSQAAEETAVGSAVGAGPTSSEGAVTALCRIPGRGQVAAGHSTGSLKLWNLSTGFCEASFSGHKTAVSCLAYSPEKATLASGGRDSDIVLWDLVSESGLFRLKGHRNEVTALVFLPEHDSLVSSSKDACIRVWSLGSQHCTQVVTMHRGEVWSMDLSHDRRCLVTGSLDDQLLCFRVKTVEELEEEGEESNASIIGSSSDVLTPSGTLVRRSQSRVQQLLFDSSSGSRGSKYFGVLGVGKVFELYRTLTAKESAKKAKRKLKRKREKEKQLASQSPGGMESGGATGSAGKDDGPSVAAEPTLADDFQLETTISLKHKIKSFFFTSSRSGKLRIVLALANNSLEVYELNQKSEPEDSGMEALRIHSLDSQGHGGDVRSLSVSNDNSMILSCSYNGIKIWNSNSGNCLRACAGGYGLCCTFVVGDRYACVGTKSGAIEVYDVSFGGKIQVIDAHEQAVWSMRALPDSSGLVSVSGDGQIKFWEYGMLTTDADTENASKALTLEHKRSLKMPEDVLCIAIDNEGKYIAVGLIDASIKMFFTDTLKFYLSLYGHKLPVLCCDISSDGTLLASGSADKNLKIWGVDFGDCHKSLFAHTDSVTQVKFVPKTHYLFTAGKDGVLKYWDADKFELLLELKAHHSEIWSLAVSSGGEFCITGSHDTSIRRWDRTEEAFFLEEEKEKRLETMFDSVLDDDNIEKLNAAWEAEGASAAAGKKSQQTVTAADSAIDALDIANHELERIEEHRTQVEKGRNKAKFVPNPLLLGREPLDFVFETLKKIKSSDIEQALILLPFNDALKVLAYCESWLKDPMETEFTCKIVMTLVRIHLDQIQNTTNVKPLLSSLRELMRPSLGRIKSIIGTNKAAITFLRMKTEAA